MFWFKGGLSSLDLVSQHSVVLLASRGWLNCSVSYQQQQQLCLKTPVKTTARWLQSLKHLTTGKWGYIVSVLMYVKQIIGRNFVRNQMVSPAPHVTLFREFVVEDGWMDILSEIQTKWLKSAIFQSAVSFQLFTNLHFHVSYRYFITGFKVWLQVRLC